MKRGSLILQFFLLTTGVFTLIGLAAFNFVKSRTGHLERELRANYAYLVASMLDEALTQHGERSVEIFHRMGEATSLLKFDWWLVRENGSLVPYEGSRPMPDHIRQIPPPKHADEPEIPRSSAPNDWTVTMRLKKNPHLYLILDRVPTHGKAGMQVRNSIAFVIFVTSVGTVFISLGFLLLYLRSRSNEAKSVLKRLQGGELNARFKVRREDEVGGLMLQFNEMAGEIERLVQALQRNERVKVELLQELGHDLRTPLTTIQNSLETLADGDTKMNAALRKESLTLTLQELSYIKKLLEDLFFIARMNEPRYATSTQKVDLRNLVLSEVKAVAQNPLSQHLKWDWTGLTESAEIYGDSNLLQRMVRNVLNNARRFAQKEVRVSIEKQPAGDLVLKIADDGGGFSSQALENYGNRDKSRTLPKIGAGEISTGLGSVIVKSVAKLHNAQVEVKNKNQGAEVGIHFKKAA